ncbi:hypothetical protein GIB67_010587 [Kingdonia uniflora]|uniref:Transposase n=1 Tax=Kingdonia uniflora TaxID=39325 RepID=A0A7J7MAU6_9MAGN|nr:hypothetical protein GIB67_010587 [Kingdonia uniflora]
MADLNSSIPHGTVFDLSIIYHGKIVDVKGDSNLLYLWRYNDVKVSLVNITLRAKKPTPAPKKPTPTPKTKVSVEPKEKAHTKPKRKGSSSGALKRKRTTKSKLPEETLDDTPMLYDSEDDVIILDKNVGENAGVNDGVGVDVDGGGGNNQTGVNNWAEIDPDNLNAKEGYYSTHTSLDENDVNIGNPHQLVEDLVHEIEWPTVHDTRAYIRRWSIVNKNYPDGHTFKLRKSNALKHIYKGIGKTSNKLAHAGWVANKVEHTMRIIRSIGPVDVIKLIFVKFGLDISYYTSWNAWTICMERIVGSFDDGYVVQPELCRQILSANPGSLARSSKDVETNVDGNLCCLQGLF